MSATGMFTNSMRPACAGVVMVGLQSEVRWCTSGRPAQPAELIGDATLLPPARSAATARSWTLQEPEIERRKYQDNTDVHQQPSPELVPEEQDVHADHD